MAGASAHGQKNKVSIQAAINVLESVRSPCERQPASGCLSEGVIPRILHLFVWAADILHDTLRSACIKQMAKACLMLLFEPPHPSSGPRLQPHKPGRHAGASARSKHQATKAGGHRQPIKAASQPMHSKQQRQQAAAAHRQADSAGKLSS